MWRLKKSLLLGITVICLLTLSCSASVIRSSNTSGPQDTQRQCVGEDDLWLTTIPSIVTAAVVCGGVICMILYINWVTKRKNEEDLANVLFVMTTSAEMKEPLEILRDGIKQQLKEVKTELRSVEESLNRAESEMTADTSEEHLKEKEKLLETKEQLETRKEELEKLECNTDKLQHSAEQINRRVTKHVEQRDQTFKD